MFNQWPAWLDVRLDGANDLVDIDPNETKVVEGDAFVLAYRRSPQVTKQTNLKRTVTLNVLVNDKLPSWQGKTFLSAKYPKVIDADDVAGSPIVPTDTPLKSEIITPTYTITQTPTITLTPTEAPPTITPTKTATRSGPAPTLAEIRLGRTIRFFADNTPLPANEPVHIDASRAGGSTLMLQVAPGVGRRGQANQG